MKIRLLFTLVVAVFACSAMALRDHDHPQKQDPAVARFEKEWPTYKDSQPLARTLKKINLSKVKVAGVMHLILFLPVRDAAIACIEVVDKDGKSLMSPLVLSNEPAQAAIAPADIKEAGITLGPLKGRENATVVVRLINPDSKGHAGPVRLSVAKAKLETPRG